MMKIYISGKISGTNLLFTKSFFDSVATEIAMKGHEPVNPFVINAEPKRWWIDYMKADIKELVKCDAILMLPTWRTSKGAIIELIIAYFCGLKIYFKIEKI